MWHLAIYFNSQMPCGTLNFFILVILWKQECGEDHMSFWYDFKVFTVEITLKIDTCIYTLN